MSQVELTYSFILQECEIPLPNECDTNHKTLRKICNSYKLQFGYTSDTFKFIFFDQIVFIIDNKYIYFPTDYGFDDKIEIFIKNIDIFINNISKNQNGILSFASYNNEKSKILFEFIDGEFRFIKDNNPVNYLKNSSSLINILNCFKFDLIAKI